MKYVSMVAVAFLFLVASCGNDRLEYGEDAGSNTDQNNNTQLNTNPDPNSGYECEVTLQSSERIAVWLETDNGWFEFGPEYTVEECPDGPRYYLGFNPMGIFVVAARHDLEMSSNCAVDMYKINESPAEPLNFWEFEATLNSFWMLPGYWVFDFFPNIEGQAEGLELSASAFICALDLDMLNLGCSGEINPAFFQNEGRVTHATYYEGEWMPILRFGLVR